MATTVVDMDMNQSNIEHNYSQTNIPQDSWQTVVTNVKKRSNSSGDVSIVNDFNKKAKSSPETPSLRLQNRFEPLSKDMEVHQTIETSESTEQSKEPKPPPIFIPCVVNLVSMMKELEKMVNRSQFTYKCLNQDKIKIMPASSDAYRKIVKGLSGLNINFHTYQLKQNRAYRVVLKNMHYSTPVEAIQEAIEDEGHKVRNIINVRQNVTKVPLSMFFVDLEPNPNNKTIYNVVYLLNAKIKFEPPNKKKEIIQCKKCQQFGHTKTYCWNVPCCVKCGEKHETSKCTKSDQTPPICIHCDGNHPASYRGCPVYRELQNKRFPPLRNKSQQPSSVDQSSDPASVSPNSANPKPREVKFVNPQVSFARVVSGGVGEDTVPNESNDSVNICKMLQESFTKFENILIKQSEQIGTLLNLLTAVIAKLK